MLVALLLQLYFLSVERKAYSQQNWLISTGLIPTESNRSVGNVTDCILTLIELIRLHKNHENEMFACKRDKLPASS